jgi:hypothetical protein
VPLRGVQQPRTGSFLGGIVLEGDALEPGERVPNVRFVVDRQASLP